jgi:hypothetical protein
MTDNIFTRMKITSRKAANISIGAYDRFVAKRDTLHLDPGDPWDGRQR